MTYSEFTLTFNSDLDIGDEIVIRAGSTDLGIITAYRQKWVALRSSSSQVTQGVPTSNPGERSAINFIAAFNLDYNPGSFFQVTRVVNVVTMKLIFNPWDFYQPTTPDPLLPSGPYPALPDGVELVITNYTGETITIDSLTFSEATENSTCTHYKVNVETNILAVEIQYPNLFADFIINEDNPFSFELPRGQQFSLVCKAEDGQFVVVTKQSFEVPQLLTTTNFNLTVNNSIYGSTLIVNNNVYTSVNNYEFSLDNETWQVSNVFNGLVEGSYTLYIRDQFGCLIEIDFEAGENASRKPYFFISKANSIPFKESVDWNCEKFKNDDNLLSYQSLNKLPYCDNVLFNKCDKKTKIQFKSNYENNLVYLRREGFPDVELDVIQQSNNLNRFQSLDAIKYKYSSTQTGIYFDSGSMYNELGVPIQDYVLNGNLPDLAILNSYIEIQGIGYFQILEIIYDPNVNKKVLIIDLVTVSDVPEFCIVKSIYDLLNFEVYEFEIDWSLLDVDIYDIIILSSDDTNGELNHISENIFLSEDHERTLYIEYFNSNNRDVFYKYGIKHGIRVAYQNIYADIDDSVELNKTDERSSIISSTVADGNLFVFSDVSREFLLRLKIALSLENVIINGTGYVKKEPISAEPIEGTNFYSVEANMLKSNYRYNNNRNIDDSTIDGDIVFNIPPLIVDENNNFTTT